MSSSVVTLGTFDGVHRGHLAILRKVIRRARAIKAESMVLAFGRPPRHAGVAHTKPVLLTTLKEKIQMMRRIGIRGIRILAFDKKTASTPPEEFFCRTILKRFCAREMVVGPRLAFGRHRRGRLPLLRKLGKRYAVKIHVVSPVNRGHRTVSSRRIRTLLWRGNVEKANELLGYAYTAQGRVVKGDRRGHLLGYPTANLEIDPDKILPPGVFWVKVYPGAREAVCNVGTHPTFTPHSHQRHCEVFILKGKHKLYGKTLRVEFLRRIRPEKHFTNSEKLQRQIANDIRKTISFT